MPITLVIPESKEMYDESTNTFVRFPAATIEIEHSLISLSKWESKWHKPYLSKDKRTAEEELDYVRCMTLTKNVDPNAYYGLTKANLEEIRAYVNDSMTATTFRESDKKSRQIITNELIYHWMIECGIPFECQKWHLNRLLTLIRVRTEMKQDPKKIPKKDLYKRNTDLNKARRAAMNSKG